MSRQFNQTVGSMPSNRPSGTVTTVGLPVTPLVYGAPQARYTMAPPHPGQQFIPASVNYMSSHVAGVPSTVPLVGSGPGAASLQRVYVPVQRMPLHVYASVPAGQLPATDFSKLVEEQKKFEKERNFQWQQQRLKQFTVAGKKGSLNADSLLDSMFGKPDLKKGNAKQLPNESNTDCKTKQVVTVPKSIKSVSQPLHHEMEKSEMIYISTSESKENCATDPKKLENMMLQCSSLSGPQRAKGFQKPLVKEISRMPQNTKTFSTSQKAINWTDIQGLENVFSEPGLRFPPWCKKEAVPPLYQQVEKIVTNDDSHAPDTNLLFPILLSSGLTQKSLGEIWELVNVTTPGQLANEEMYAALALIAVVQAGHRVTDLSILHRLPSCPVPILQCFQPPSSIPESTSTAPISKSTANSPTSNSDPLPPENLKLSESTDVPKPSTIRPAYIPLVKNSNTGAVPKPLSSWSPFGASDSGTPIADDDFDDFKSATPVAINAPPMIISSTTSQMPDDEFDDFKQADSAITASLSKLQLSQPPKGMKGLGITDLLLPDDDDKYSVFRTLQLTSSDAAVAVSVPTSAATETITSPANDATLSEKEQNLKTASETGIKEISNDKLDEIDDEFGDFLDARAELVAAPTHELLSTATEPCTFAPNFADFTKLTESPGQTENCSLLTTVKQSAEKRTEDAEFGDFAAFRTSKVELGQDYFFPCNKDSISLTETQSISSLELGTFDGTLQLGTFDGTLQSGEVKTSLSRQGSIPSLDLRCTSIEGVDVEDGFGELQSAVAKSPTPSIDTNKSSDERSSNSITSLTFPSTPIVPLTDKYSVIRSEQLKYEDQHVSDWTRCVEGCLMILQKATRIFNQMSCSSVCHEVLSTEEGKNYVKNVIEVYRIVCRVALASKSYEKQDNKLQGLIADCDKSFHALSTFLAGSVLLPEDSSLDFSLGLLRSNHDSNEKACGVCLLNVDSRSKAFNKSEDFNKLIYGTRQYHSTCANLWVNYVDPLLPVLTLPQLI